MVRLSILSGYAAVSIVDTALQAQSGSSRGVLHRLVETDSPSPMMVPDFDLSWIYFSVLRAYSSHGGRERCERYFAFLKLESVAKDILRS